MLLVGEWFNYAHFEKYIYTHMWSRVFWNDTMQKLRKLWMSELLWLLPHMINANQNDILFFFLFFLIM